MPFNGKARFPRPYRAVVTGASSGIGRAIAEQLAGCGAELIITARREDRLRTLAGEWSKAYGVPITVTAGDITQEETRRRLIEAAETLFGSSSDGGLDLLVNNAGAGGTAEVEMTSEGAARGLMELNFFAPLFLTQGFLPLLRRRASSAGGGKLPVSVLFLSSVVGFRGTPHYGVYGAAKSAVLTLADALRAELARDRIEVLWAAPGTTQTEFFDRLIENRSMPHFPEHKSVSAEEAAREILAAVYARRHRVIPHRESRILDRLNRICPRFVDWVMTKYR